MFHRFASAALLLGFLVASAIAQKDTPKPTKPTGALTWETVAADKASKLTTKRAQVPGGWLVVVQTGDDMSLAFFPDADHRWDDKSPSDANPAKPKFDDITKSAGLDKAKAEIEQARAAAAGERDKALVTQKELEEELKRLQAELEKSKKEAEYNLDLAKKNEAESLKQKAMAEAQREKAQVAQKKAEDELKKLQAELDKAKKAKKPKKGEKDDQATQAERQRIAEALGLAARDESQKAKSLADQARAAAVAERDKSEAVQKRLAETATKLGEAIRQRKECEDAKVAGELRLKVAEVARREALVQKDKAEAVGKEFQKEALEQKAKAEAVTQEFQKQLLETTTILEITRASEKRNAVVAANAEAESQRLKAENDLLKRENDRLRQLLDKKKK